MVNYFEKSISYFSKYNLWNTSNDVLRRDFSRFKSNGIQTVNLALYWSTLEGNNRGDYNGTTYGIVVLDGVKRAIRISGEVGLKVRVSVIAGWNDSSITPDYIIDPVTGENIALAIIRSEVMRQAFIDMYTHTISYLSDMPIWGWTILGEPWYSPYKLEPPYDEINQKQNFITLMQELTALVKSTFGYDIHVDVNFVSAHWWTQPDGSPGVINLFEHHWEWDDRIFQTLDSIRWSYHPFEALQRFPDYPEIYDKILNITRYNVEESRARGKKVFLTAGTDGGDSNDDGIQANTWRKLLADIATFPIDGLVAFGWNGEDRFGKGMNLCANEDGGPRPAYYEFVGFKL
jgi:hypothetical protein